MGKKNGNGNLQEKNPLNLDARFPPQRKLPVAYFKEAAMFYLTKSNYHPK